MNPYSSKIVSPIDTITPSFKDTLDILKRPPKRLVYQHESGVFLNEIQEQITLEKLLWKEQYRQDAVSMYYVNVALEERVREVVQKNKALEDALNKSEINSLKFAADAAHYEDLYDASKIKITSLEKEVKTEKTKKVLYMLGAGAGAIYVTMDLIVLPVIAIIKK